ncbi:cobalamin-dependent protein [Streptomyces roseus]|uniref:cobalamin B12-binding domain-containing protein n=1 Tax=Streptomyces roseus TaxID=66430 RepID=UPI003408D219
MELDTAIGTVDTWPRERHTVVVSSMASDSHTWNLVFLQLLLEELGHDVINLGACVPDGLLVERCLAVRPDLLVLSSVNGHGQQDGLRVIGELRRQPELAGLPVVIGGKLGIGGADPRRAPALLAAGFDAVFEEGASSAALFRTFVDRLPSGARL